MSNIDSVDVDNEIDFMFAEVIFNKSSRENLIR